MPLHGLSLCPVLWDKGCRDWIDTKEEQKDKCTIEESILRRDLWKERNQAASMVGQRELFQAGNDDLADQNKEGKRPGQKEERKRTEYRRKRKNAEQAGNEKRPEQKEKRKRTEYKRKRKNPGQAGNEKRPEQKDKGKRLWDESGEPSSEQYGDYRDHSAGLSLADTFYSVREETVICKEVSFISDYGHDLICYRLFYLPAVSGFGMDTVGLRVAEDSSRMVRCRGMPDSDLKDKTECGYGIEISLFRMKQEGFRLMEDFERLEGISEDLDTCLTFFQQLVEGRVYPCSLADLCEDYSELF